MQDFDSPIFSVLFVWTGDPGLIFRTMQPHRSQARASTSTPSNTNRLTCGHIQKSSLGGGRWWGKQLSFNFSPLPILNRLKIGNIFANFPLFVPFFRRMQHSKKMFYLLPPTKIRPWWVRLSWYEEWTGLYQAGYPAYRIFVQIDIRLLA